MISFSRNSVKGAFGLIWCFVVIFSYYSENVGYFQEKISVFGEFLIQLIGF